jgi:hypothetical protein
MTQDAKANLDVLFSNAVLHGDLPLSVFESKGMRVALRALAGTDYQGPCNKTVRKQILLQGTLGSVAAVEGVRKSLREGIRPGVCVDAGSVGHSSFFGGLRVVHAVYVPWRTQCISCMVERYVRTYPRVA